MSTVNNSGAYNYNIESSHPVTITITIQFREIVFEKIIHVKEERTISVYLITTYKTAKTISRNLPPLV